MKNKFKPGDRVICIASGEEYVISHIPDYPLIVPIPGQYSLDVLNQTWKKAYSKDYVMVEPAGYNLFMPPAFYEHEIRLTNSVKIKRRLGVI